MVDAVTFDLGGAYAPAFPLPDASGLMPLSLPEEFFHRHESSLPLPQPSSDAVMRFETAMGAEPLDSPIVEIKNLVAAGALPVPHAGITPEKSVDKPILAKDSVSFENPVIEAKVVVPRRTGPEQVMGTDPVSRGTDPVQAASIDLKQAMGTVPMQTVGTVPVIGSAVMKEGEVPDREVHVVSEVPVAPNVPIAPNKESYGAPVVALVKDSVSMGTDPAPQTETIAENSVDKPVLARNPVSFENSVVEAKVVVPKGTDPVSMRTLVVGTDPVQVGTDPEQVIGTDPVPKGTVPVQVDHVQTTGTDPVRTMGTDLVVKQAIVTEREVSGREVHVVSEVPVAPNVPVAPEAPVAPNKESYVTSVVVSAEDVSVASVQEAEVGAVVEKVVEPTSKTVLPTETKLSQETTRPAPEATSLAHETLVQVPEVAKPTVETAKPTLEVAMPILEVEPEVRLESAPAIDRAEPEDEVVALDAKQAQQLQAAPVVVAADSSGTVDAQSATAREVSAVSAETARTEAVVELVDKLVEAVVSQITVTPSIIRGEGEVRITLKANVLDGSNITLSAKDGALAVVVTPATPEAAQAIAVAAPRLEAALAEHVPTFRNVVVKLGSVSRKGNSDETA